MIVATLVSFFIYNHRLIILNSDHPIWYRELAFHIYSKAIPINKPKIVIVNTSTSVGGPPLGQKDITEGNSLDLQA